MDILLPFLTLLLGIAAGVVLTNSRASKAREQVIRLQADRDAAAEAREARIADRIADLEQMRDSFTALSAEALEKNSDNFLRLASEKQTSANRDLKELVGPLREQLGKLDTHVGELEKTRAGAYQEIRTEVRNLREGQTELRKETGNLVSALLRPETRGRWGEIQLRRVLESAGMVPGQDFFEQASRPGEEGKLRPDVIVRLPGRGQIVVDAKTPLDAYLRMVKAETDEERRDALKAHVRQVHEQVRNLGSKEYANSFPDTPDFVVMFLPADSIFAAALEGDPELLDVAMREGVVISTPATFIALAKAVAHGWRQERAARETREILDLGKNLFDRLRMFAGHYSEVGKSLGQAVDRYNKSVGSFDRRLLPATRKLVELHAAPGETEIREVPRLNESIHSLALAPQEPEILPTTKSRES